jgi:Na+-translocating ferredoxin:NAD+ oxidoreductase RnfA subunit
MIAAGTFAGMSLIAVLADRFAFGPAIGRSRDTGTDPVVKPALQLGALVIATMVPANALFWLAADLVVLPCALDYLLVLTAFSTIAVVSFAANQLLLLVSPKTGLYRLQARAAAISALLIIPLAGGTGPLQLSLAQSTVISLGAGCAFILVLTVHSSIVPHLAAGDKRQRPSAFVRELFTAALILLALQGITPFELFPW